MIRILAFTVCMCPGQEHSSLFGNLAITGLGRGLPTPALTVGLLPHRGRETCSQGFGWEYLRACHPTLSNTNTAHFVVCLLRISGARFQRLGLGSVGGWLGWVG